VGVSAIRIRSLETARLCAELGACKRPISWVTGLAPFFILRTLYDDAHPAPTGRPPYQSDYYFRRSHRVQAEASSFAVRYRSLAANGFLPSDSLLAAYKHYLSLTQCPSFNFDEAFNLVSHLEGIWVAMSATLQLSD
jgi:flagellar transcriptional activator FlhC